MFIVEGQKTASLIRDHDWSSSAMGPMEAWPQSLKLLVSVMLGSQQPMYVNWGPDHLTIYNDGYAEILGDKHPAAMGRPFLEIWSEIRGDLIPIIGKAAAGESIFMDDITLAIERKGFAEEAHFSFSYTPVRDEAGDVVGIFCPCTETTGYVLAERQLRQREKEISDALEVQRSLLEEKDLLLAEVNHRVKNSLQLVVSALSLQSRRLSDPATKAAFEQAISRVRAITSVHERLYKDDNPLVVEMGSYLKGLSEDLTPTPELRQRMNVQVDDIRLETERAIPLAIIVNELITNAMKYAYPEGRPGPIVLSLKKQGADMLELAVSDEGVGMETITTNEGLGSRLISTMASQLDGTLERNGSASGYRVSLVFPREQA